MNQGPRSRNPLARTLAARGTLLALALACVDCTMGPMRINETYYLGASNGKSRVYYRVVVPADVALRRACPPDSAVASSLWTAA